MEDKDVVMIPFVVHEGDMISCEKKKPHRHNAVSVAFWRLCGSVARSALYLV